MLQIVLSDNQSYWGFSAAQNRMGPVDHLTCVTLLFGNSGGDHYYYWNDIWQCVIHEADLCWKLGGILQSYYSFSSGLPELAGDTA